MMHDIESYGIENAVEKLERICERILEHGFSGLKGAMNSFELTIMTYHESDMISGELKDLLLEHTEFANKEGE